MFEISSRLGCRFACICVCAVLAFEAFFCTDSAFAVGRRGRVRNSQMYPSYSEPVEYSYSEAVQYAKPAAVPEAAQTPVLPEKKTAKSEAVDQKKVKAETQTASTAPQKAAENKNHSTANPAGLDLALRSNPPASPAVAPAPEKLPEILCYWFPTLNEASLAASSLGRPMLIHFYIENCGPCNWMEHQVFTQSQIQKLAGSYFVMVKLDGNQNQDLCARLGVLSFPADVIISSDGKYLAHSSGRQEVSAYSEFLMAAANQVKLPPMNKPVGPNWQKQLQLAKASVKAKTPAQPKATKPEKMSAALEVPALDPPVAQKDSSKQEEEVLEKDLFALAPPEKPAKAGKNKETLPVAEELDLMALDTKKVIRRKDVPESSIDHEVAASETPVMPARESENPRPSISPVSLETKPVLEGFSPVSLVDENKWVRGNENLTAEFENAQYCFTSEGEREKFVQNPRYYALVSGGCDVVVLAESSRKVEGDRRFGVRYEERNFIFASVENLEKFRANPDFYATKVRELAWRNAQSESVK